MALKCTAIRLLLTSLIARGLTFGLRSATTQHCVKPWHQGRHLRLSCLGAANGSACVLYQLEAQIYKAAWPSWQRGNDMAQLGNSPSFANLRMTSGWALCSDINANCKLRQEGGEGGKEGAGSKRASGMPSVVIEGALKTLRKRQVTLCPGPKLAHACGNLCCQFQSQTKLPSGCHSAAGCGGLVVQSNLNVDNGVLCRVTTHL
jgi:hypothetical protein